MTAPTQPDLFDSVASEAAKVAGMHEAAEHKSSLLKYARGLAVQIARGRLSRECTADDVAEALVDAGISSRALGNAAGSLFAGEWWEFTGRYERSARVHAHSNLLRVWRLR
jgi:hypothetical protein